MSRFDTLPDQASFVKLPRGARPETCRCLGHLSRMLCTHKTVQALEDVTRGKRGERAVIRSIERLNQRLPVTLAVVAPAATSITRHGIAAYRRYGAMAHLIGGFVAALQR